MKHISTTSLHDSIMENDVVTQLSDSPLFSLPIELIQEITTYLSPYEAASFSLCSHNIYYTIGSLHLSAYLSSPKTKLERRQHLEVIERAFPTHWYCAWCDRFHKLEPGTGPTMLNEEESKRDCTEHCSYLHYNRQYVLTYHHIRLAMNRHLWGPGHGIPLSDLHYDHKSTASIFRTQYPISVTLIPRIVSSNLLLYSAFSIELPENMLCKKGLWTALFPYIPHIVAGHRNDREGHTGLKYQAKLQLQNPRSRSIQLCSVCATDYLVTVAPRFPSPLEYTPTSAISSVITGPSSSSVTSYWILKIEAWRDLGGCRNPFSSCWRAHGEIGNGFEGYGGDLMRLAGCETGSIRGEYERGGWEGENSGSDREGPRNA